MCEPCVEVVHVYGQRGVPCVLIVNEPFVAAAPCVTVSGAAAPADPSTLHPLQGPTAELPLPSCWPKLDALWERVRRLSRQALTVSRCHFDMFILVTFFFFFVAAVRFSFRPPLPPLVMIDTSTFPTQRLGLRSHKSSGPPLHVQTGG